ncbi:elongation factor P [candidate division WOR-3 bacterium]|uniref:Elongation factor P n=1 Tax=candidate division WOR-3 bacterium TaxID=2052148 RepID=A0A9D5K9X1_UNCW3|nr:elongation factor P [candidate division WOR-3 bacterium]MBD3363966.1 elongation factor P [candidate division WOR-3 bacterium]
MIPATQVKTGNCVVLEGEPHIVTERRHVTQGRKPGKIQLKLRNVVTGLSTEKRYSSNDKVELATLEEKEMQYLYEDGGLFFFMDTENYEQKPISVDLIGDNRYYLTDGAVITVLLFEGKPVGVRPPLTVVLEITYTEPGLKHATAQAQLKPAETNTGLRVNVPAFLEIGDKIRIKTETGEYMERVT